MTKNEFVVGMAILDESNLAKTVSFNKKNLALWYVYFGNHDYEHFIVAVMSYISKNKFYPTISDLLSGIEDVIHYNTLLCLPEKAWNDLENGKKNELAFKIANESGINISIDGKLIIGDEGAKRRFINHYRDHANTEIRKKNIVQIRDTVELIKSIGMDSVKSLANTKELIKEK